MLSAGFLCFDSCEIDRDIHFHKSPILSTVINCAFKNRFFSDSALSEPDSESSDYAGAEYNASFHLKLQVGLA